ncbi:MAG TPA: AAA family ATPase, partial [Candidatus Dormibacteraeota bacterium]|nr:AAA family ATPase [Candidatus Dormibacteraeota bacterium]
DDDLRLLKDLYHATSREGRARLVSVIGPAGIGKTRLAWEFLKYIDGLEEGVWWHQGRSPAYGEGISFWALGEMIRARCGLLETDDDATTRAKVAETVREHIQDDGERRWIEGALLALLGVGGASAVTDQLFAAWRTFFERLAGTGPVVMVFEDLHYADSGLLDFIDQLLEWSRSHPIYVLTLARPELVERRPGWQAKRNFTSVYLEPLPDAAMRELLGGLVPGLPDAAVRAIVARADGVPLYAVETVRMLLAEGKLEQREDTYVPTGDLTDLAVPETLTALIASRLDGLSADDRALVHDAAVLGQAFTLAGLAAVSGLPEADLEPRLRTLVRRELLALEADPRSPERGQYTFVQALIREVAYNTLAKKDRKARHLAAARFFEGLGSDELAGALAGHYLAAYRNAPEGAEADALAAQARIALRAAADRAAALGSFEQASDFYEQAFSVSNDPAEQADLLGRSGDAASKAAHHEVAVERLRRALELRSDGDDRLAVLRAADALGRGLLAAFRGDEAAEVAEAALADVADASETTEGIALVVTLARALGFREENARAVELAQQALVAAERMDALPLIAQALNVYGNQLARLGRPVEALVLLRGGIALAEEAGLTTDALAGRVGLALTVQNRDPLEAVEIGRAGLADAKRAGLRGRAIYFVGNAAEAARFPGEWDWALTELTAMLTWDLDDPDRSWLLACETVLHAWRGVDVRERMTELRALYERIGRSSLDSDEFDLEACVALAEGRLADARRFWHDVARVSSLNAPNAYPLATRVATWLRDVEGARDDLAAFEATGVRGAFTQLRRKGFAASIAALEGRTSEARALYAEARRGLLDRGIVFEAALVGIDMATTLGPGDADVIAAVDETRAILERLGARPFLARLDAALAEEPPAPIAGSSRSAGARIGNAVEA